MKGFTTGIFMLFISVITQMNAFGQAWQNPLGKSYNSVELDDHLRFFKGDTSNEELNPYTKTYAVKLFSKGVKYSFNPSLALTGVEYFDEGSKYESFIGKLPHRLKWNLHIDSALLLGIPWTIDDFNPFLLNAKYYGYSLTAFFTNDRLTSIRIIGDPEVIAKNSKDVTSNWGMRLLRNGKVVEGDCSYNKGLMSWEQNSVFYTGQWLFGLPHGYGVYQDTFGNTYEGQFKMGFFWGQGKFVGSDKSVYAGSFVMGKKHGNGKMIFRNTTRYNGDWFQNVMHGKGEFYFSKTNYYKGRMVFNQFGGYGEMYSPSGTYKGQFKQGKPHGKGTQLGAGGGALTGRWVEGKKEGAFLIKLPNGKTSNITFKNDQEIN